MHIFLELLFWILFTSLCSMVAFLAIKTIVRDRRLARLRKGLDEKIAELNAIENVIRLYSSRPLLDDILAYINSLGVKSWTQLYKKFVLLWDEDLSQGLQRLERDALKDRWVLPYDITGLEEVLQDETRKQYRIWLGRRARIREECSNLQAYIEELEQKMKIKKEPTADNPDDKRVELKKLRVEITERRLKEERLEKEILDEQGVDAPNRRAAGVPTDD